MIMLAKVNLRIVGRNRYNRYIYTYIQRQTGWHYSLYQSKEMTHKLFDASCKHTNLSEGDACGICDVISPVFSRPFVSTFST